ncbi:MAG: bifunctional precorrin-2 dehydrogenase/sirohydrochlorin ferrochelatase [Chloroflexi bacterium]|nr:bifunctional precorrin-2 dehydrogenase/sirohydrochlorin ferrochelatase [Chloroflexota bacterium]
MPAYYPVFLNLAGKRCVIIGGGAIAEGKISKLKETGAQVTIISPDATPAIQKMAKKGVVEWTARKYQPGDLAGAFLGIAATDVRQVNQQIFEEAKELGVVLNVVDDPDLCAFIAPSVVERGPVTVAISTGGASPALARKLREALTDSPALEWADLAHVLSKARKEIKKRGVAVDPQRWQCCLTPDLLSLAQAGQEEQALKQIMSGLLDEDATGLCPDVKKCRSEGCSTQG